MEAWVQTRNVVISVRGRTAIQSVIFIATWRMEKAERVGREAGSWPDLTSTRDASQRTSGRSCDRRSLQRC